MAGHEFSIVNRYLTILPAKEPSNTLTGTYLDVPRHLDTAGRNTTSGVNRVFKTRRLEVRSARIAMSVGGGFRLAPGSRRSRFQFLA